MGAEILGPIGSVGVATAAATETLSGLGAVASASTAPQVVAPADTRAPASGPVQAPSTPGLSATALAARRFLPVRTGTSSGQAAVEMWRGVWQPPRQLPPQGTETQPQTFSRLVLDYNRVISAFFDQEGHLNADALLLASIGLNPRYLEGFKAGTVAEIFDQMDLSLSETLGTEQRRTLEQIAALSGLSTGMLTSTLLMGYWLYHDFLPPFVSILGAGFGFGMATYLFISKNVVRIIHPNRKSCKAALAANANVDKYYLDHAGSFTSNMEKTVDEILAVVLRLKKHLEDSLKSLESLSATDPNVIQAKAMYGVKLTRVTTTEKFFTDLKLQLPAIAENLAGLAALAHLTPTQELTPTQVQPGQLSSLRDLFASIEPLVRTARELDMPVDEIKAMD